MEYRVLKANWKPGPVALRRLPTPDSTVYASPDDLNRYGRLPGVRGPGIGELL
jgi:hypothetical protein